MISDTSPLRTQKTPEKSSSLSVSPTQVAPTPPVNTTAPAITGTARDGELLSVSTGTWAGTPTITYAYAWQRCDAAGANCAAIAGATAATYRLAAADTGRTIRAVVTATNAAGSAPATTTATATVSAAPPVSTALPSIAGTARDGETLTGTTGTWTGTAPITFTYAWRRCDVSGANCAAIAGATSQTYAAAVAEIGSTLRLAVTATNSAGSATAVSAASERVTAAPPVNTVAPALSGTARDGATLTVSSDGTWTGTRPLSFAYQWQRCDAAGASCTDIAGATTTSYTATPADVGGTVRARVTATNTAGSSAATTAASVQVAAAPPVNTSVPTVAGVATEGATLSAQPGSWTGTPAISYANAWQRCDAAGANCAAIAGATATTYTTTAADTGRRIRVAVTATNSAGSATAVSATASVNPAAPANTAAPSVTGTTREGSTLTAAEGTWSGSQPITYAYQWVRCDASGVSCSDIPGATSRTYVAVPADVDGRLRVRVTATNSAGNATVTSGPSAAITARAPVNTTAPSVSGTPRDGETLTAATGTWTGTAPIGLAVRWQRCTTATTCADIAGATATTYTARPADVGTTLRVLVTASNAGGTASAPSAQTATVAAAPPVNVTSPTISGDARDGAVLTATTGAWNGTAPITYAYQWQRCNAAGASCAAIAGATGANHTAAAADVGGTLRVGVTATNPGGTSTATSPATAIVAPTPPVNTAAPTISGTPRDGVTLTAANGTWTGTAPIAYAYRWQRCDAAGTDCADITGATGSTFTPGADEVGRTVRVVVTGTNAAGATSAASSPSAAIAPAAPVNTAAPAITGTPVDGATLTAEPGTWTGTRADQLRLRLAPLRRRGRELRRHRGRDRAHLHRHRRRPRPHAAGRRHRDERGRHRHRHVAGLRRRRRRPAGQPDRADHHRHAARRRDAVRRPGHLDRNRADRLRPPVAALRRRRRRLRPDRRGDGLHLHGDGRRRRHHRARRRHRHEHRRKRRRAVVAHRDRRPRRAGEHDRADGDRHAARRRDAQRLDRRLGWHRADHVRLRVAAL